MLSRDGAIGLFHVHLSFTFVCGHVLLIWSPCVHFLPHWKIVVFLVPLICAHTHAQWQLVENILGAARAV